MNSTWFQHLSEVSRKMWARVLLFSIAGVALALLASWARPLVPYVPKIDLASGSVNALLSIIASSMLTVTTFSMSIIVGAYGSASTSATPRATQLLAEDSVAQTSVSVFIGSFLFSIVGIIGLSAGFYADQARVILFAATLIDILLIVWALLRWVNHLNAFGRMKDIVARIEKAATEAARLYADQPRLGAAPMPDQPRQGQPVVRADGPGFVRFIDMPALQEAAADLDCTVEILRMPGKYVHHGEELLALSCAPDAGQMKRLRAAFSIGASRSFDQDMRYGLLVLAEVASRALSPAINDAGTAIDVLRTGTRVLAEYHLHDQIRLGAVGARAEPEPLYPRVRAPAIDISEAYRELFGPVLRYGAEEPALMQTLRDSLDALDRMGGDRVMVRRFRNDIRQRAIRQPLRPWERSTLR